MSREDRAVGTLLGLACGDALGRPVEGLSGAEVARRYGRVTEMRAGGPRGQPAGTTTGETALALRVARSLRDRGGFDASEAPSAATAGQGDAPTGTPASGVLVRAVPPAIACSDPGRLATAVAESVRPTHPAPAAVESSVALGRVVAGLLDGADATTALDDALSLAVRRDAPDAVRTALAVATDGAAASVGDGGRDAVGTLEAALHDALTADGPESAVVAAVSRGGRAATAGAVTGAVAGARFGARALPVRWVDHLDATADLRDLAVALHGIHERSFE